MARALTKKDQGKRVVNNAGDEIGMISDVTDGTAFVDPDPGLTDKVLSRLGWDDVDEDHYELDQAQIDTITTDEVRLK
jgi:hypothetical protein